MPDDLHPEVDTDSSPQEDVPVEQLISRIKTSRDTPDMVDAVQKLIEQSRRRREDA
jgi:hypothetical protein